MSMARHRCFFDRAEILCFSGILGLPAVRFAIVWSIAGTLCLTCDVVDYIAHPSGESYVHSSFTRSL